MKLCKILFCTLIGLFATNNAIKAQTKHQIGFVTDNDLYVSLYLDGYYTNGLQLHYKRAYSTKSTFYDKKIRSFLLTQKIYNPQVSNVPYVTWQERPYAGYLYANYTEQFISQTSIFAIGVHMGVVGKSAGAEWAQNFIHQFYDKEPSKGWDTQVKQKLSLGVLASYTRQILYKKDTPISLLWTSKTTLNTVVSHVSTGLGIKFNLIKSFLKPLSNSSFYNTALLVDKEKWTREIFMGIKSYATYQIQDVTVTGTLQQNPFQKVFDLQPWVWHNDIGVYWNLKHLNISYHQIFSTRDVKQIEPKWVRYGSIQLAYKF